MIQRYTKRFAVAVCAAMAMCASATNQACAQVEDFPALQFSPQTRPACDLWIEGEKFTRNTGWEIRADATCYDGRVAVLSTKVPGDYCIDYDFTVAQAGEYLVCVAGQPLGQGYTSPITVSFDGAAWTNPAGGASSTSAWGPSGAVNWTNLILAKLQAGKHIFSVRVNTPRSDGVTAYMIDAIALIHEPYRRLNIAPKLVTDRPGNVFTAREKTVFRLKWQNDFGTIAWRVTDWQKNDVAHGSWKSSQGPLELAELPAGFYRLTWKDAKGRQGVIPFSRVIDPADRVIDNDSPFAIDSAQSWHAVTRGNRFAPTDPHRYLARLLQLAGVTVVRDRFNWNQEQGKPCNWDFNAPVFDTLSQHGVRVCGMYHYAPPWTADASDPYGLPYDLVALYDFCRAASKRFDREVIAWEFWNEQDASNMPAWYYTAAMKAAYLGYKAGNPKQRVLNGASCLHPVPRFMDIFMQNGAKDYFDVYNFHLYSLQDNVEAVRDEQDFLRRYDAADKPIWITENGLLLGGSAEPIDPATTFYEHNEQEELAQAEYVIKAQLRFASYGIDRNFSFALIPYNEMGRGRVWGMLRWDYAAKPVYTAFANMTAQLAKARCLGQAALGAGVVGVVFQQPSGDRIGVVWLDSANAATVTLKDSAASLQCVDFMGRQTTLQPQNGAYQIPIGKYPTYIHGLKDIQPRASAATRPSSTSPAPSDDAKDLTIVIQPNLKTGFETVRNKARLDASNRGQIVLNVFNLSETAKRGHIDNLGRGYTISGLPETIDIPAMGEVSLTIDVTFDATGDDFVAFRLGGEFAGRKISPVYIPVKRTSAVAPTDWPKKSLLVEDVARWKKNSSGTMTIARDDAEKCMVFNVTYPPSVDQWVYPEFPLNLPTESMAGAIGIEFDVRASHDEYWAMVQAVLAPTAPEGSNQMCWLPYLPTTKWQTVRILFEEDAPASFDPARMLMFRFGVNPSVREFQYRLRNFHLLYPRGSAR